MGKADILSKQYMSDNAIFADAFNFYIYSGRQTILPENLKVLDPVAIAAPFSITDAELGKKQKSYPIQKYRDVFRNLVAMEDEHTTYLALGIENQAHVHYAMPLRNMLYDVLEYVRQAEKLAAMHRLKKDLDSRHPEEFLSGLKNDDKFVPVITLVIYFGQGQWNGAKSVHEMLECPDPNLLQYIADYRLNIIVPAELSEKDFLKFRTNLREVMEYIQCSTDKDRLDRLIKNNSHFSKMERNAAMLLNECTNSGLKFNGSEGSVDMCKAIYELKQEERNAGISIGRNEGLNEGIMIGTARTMLEFGKDGTEIIGYLMKVYHISTQEASTYLGMALAWES